MAYKYQPREATVHDLLINGIETRGSCDPPAYDFFCKECEREGKRAKFSQPGRALLHARQEHAGVLNPGDF
jgi:hypothetical protein